jgi:hypothetical protein
MALTMRCQTPCSDERNGDCASAGIFGTANIFQVKHDLPSYAAGLSRREDFEVRKLDQGIRRPIVLNVEHFEDIPSDGILGSRSQPGPRIFVYQQFSETDVQFDGNREGLLPTGAAGRGPNPEKQGNS